MTRPAPVPSRTCFTLLPYQGGGGLWVLSPMHFTDSHGSVWPIPLDLLMHALDFEGAWQP